LSSAGTLGRVSTLIRGRKEVIIFPLSLLPSGLHLLDIFSSLSMVNGYPEGIRYLLILKWLGFKP